MSGFLPSDGTQVREPSGGSSSLQTGAVVYNESVIEAHSFDEPDGARTRVRVQPQSTEKGLPEKSRKPFSCASGTSHSLYTTGQFFATGHLRNEPRIG